MVVRMLIRLISIAVFFALVVAGCSQPLEPGVYVSDDHPKFIKDMAAGDVIVRVNGVSIYKRDFTQLLQLQENLYRIRNGLPIKGRNELAERFTFSNEQRWPELLIKNELMAQEAKVLELSVDSTAIDQRWQAISKIINRKGNSLVDFRQELGKEFEKPFLALLEAECLNDLILKAVITNDFETVTAEEITNRMDWVRAFNKNADDRNAEAVELLKKVKAEVLAGKDFAAAAKEYSEVKPEEGSSWESFELNELPDDRDGTKNELRVWLEKAKVGDVSDPIDMEDGISICKLVSTYEGEAPEGWAKPTCYRLVRCTRFAREHSREQNEVETRNQLLKWKREEVLAELGQQIFDAAVLEFPNGTNFFPEAEESYKYWQEEFKRRK